MTVKPITLEPAPTWICHRCGRRARAGRVYVNIRHALNGHATWTVTHWGCDTGDDGPIWDANCYYLNIESDLVTAARARETYEHVRVKRWASHTNWTATVSAALNR